MANSTLMKARKQCLRRQTRALDSVLAPARTHIS